LSQKTKNFNKGCFMKKVVMGCCDGLVASHVVAALLEVSPYTLRAWRADGTLPFFKVVGNRGYYRFHDVAKFAETYRRRRRSRSRVTK
jgi:hypothetical protein